MQRATAEASPDDYGLTTMEQRGCRRARMVCRIECAFQDGDDRLDEVV